MTPASAVRRHAAALALLFMAAAARGQAGATPLEARLDAIVVREHAAGRLDGVVLVGQGDAVIYRRAVGMADREQGKAHRADETWRLASVSKQVAALLVMQQVERGRITLETTLAQALPDFKSPSATQVTLRQLLQHTSGLPNPDATLAAGAPPDAMPPFYTATFTDEAGPLKAALAYCAGPPVALSGAGFSYNNCDTLVLQAVLERLSEQSYAGLLRDAVARPLGLGTLAMVTPELAASSPVGYVSASAREAPFNLATFGASGAVVGSADDLWQLDRALMQHRLLGEAATRTMWAGDPRLGYVALGAWSFTASLAGCAGTVGLIERRGQIGGVQVRNLIAPGRSAAVIVLTNTADTEFGEIWQGRGLMHEMAGAAFCGSSA